NIFNNVKIQAATFMVNGHTVGATNLTGIDMEPTVTYDGELHQIATGTLALTGVTGLSLGTVQYGVSTSNTAAPTEWFDDVTTLTATDAGTHYLWVKWPGSDTVVANSTGIPYKTFTINKYTATTTTLAFDEGNTFSSEWGDADYSDGTYAIFSKPFKNSAYTMGEMTGPTAIVTDKPNILSSEFGTFKFAVGTAEKATTSYFTVEDYGKLNVTAVDNYYLWIMWDGGDNVNPGTSIYRLKNSTDDKDYIPVFKINQLTDVSVVALAATTYANSNGSNLPYQYDVITSGTSANFEGKSQELFTASGTPELTINGIAYSGTVTYYYLSAPTSLGQSDVASRDDWVGSIAEATGTDVGVYNLWVKAVINNTNVSTTYVTKLTTETATIVATESFVAIAPTAKQDLEYTGNELELINASDQIAPKIEYRLGEDGEWTDKPAEITATAAGVYTVYYRGAAYENIFTKQETNLKYVSVEITAKMEGIEDRPKAISGVIYTGRDIPAVDLFTAGTTSDADVSISYSWEESGIFVEATLLEEGKINAGTYKLYYRLDTKNDSIDIDKSVASFEVEILKANIGAVSLTVNQGDLIYKAANYHLFSDQDNYFVDYPIVDSSGNTLTNSSGVKLTYQNRSTSGADEMGAIHYGFSTATNEQPTTWETDYKNIVARTVGDYYLWVKVDAGDNHNGSEPQCCNPSNPITIKPFTNESLATKFSCTPYAGLRYNGKEQPLLKELSVGYSVPNRNNAGVYVDTEGNETTFANAAQNEIPADELIGTFYYYLSEGATYPSTLDGWQQNWQTLTKTNFGTYYVCIQFVPSANTNITGNKIYTTAHVTSSYIGGVPKIAPAVYDDLVLFGVSAVPDIRYTGSEQTLAVGSLAVTHAISEKNITDQITDATYCFVKKGETAPTSEDTRWTTFANAAATEVGEYQLYVKLATTNNIDSTEALIYPLLGENYAEILKAAAYDLVVVKPVLKSNLVYNGKDQVLIDSPASLKMRNGAELIGIIGDAEYYISSSSSDSRVATETTNGGKVLKLKETTEIHAGTYYIWVGFTAGDSHEAITEPVYVNMVTISAANGTDINLSGIKYEATKGYNGTESPVVANGTVTQTFIVGDTPVDEADYTTVEYGISNSAGTAPTDWYDSLTAEELKVRDAGKYYVWVKVTGKDNGVTGQFNVNTYTKCYSKEECFEIMPATLSKDNIEGVSTKNNLVYIGENQTLATIPDKLKIIIDGQILDTEAYDKDLSIKWGL
ncbi:MAG: hypothetical protein IJ295_03295, partial [Clostridia bacterium]|nr:hypothetical protein [Clostridia bacterium]